KAELTTAQRGGFLNKNDKSKLAELQANVDLKATEMAYAKELLQKTQLTAPDAGIVIMNDPKEWEGRPVQIGEKILSIANPKRFELEVQLPVKDFIVLNHKTPVRLFLDSDPLNPLDVNILYMTYMPEVTPQGILAYKLVARFHNDETSLKSVRIGMRGTAKLYGESVTLFYYLFRRPITSVRQWLGW
ncbi:MAG: HlyD family secretion protein, partial [Thiomicrorhabdus sp.]|nr:HlyD family secretion protein [Thiomicrorhabdus sp.]